MTGKTTIPSNDPSACNYPNDRVKVPKWVAQVVLTSVLGILTLWVASVHARIGTLERGQIGLHARFDLLDKGIQDNSKKLRRIESYLIQSLRQNRDADHQKAPGGSKG